MQQPLNSGAASINHQATTTTTTLADFNNTHQIHQQQNSTSFLEVPYATAGGQTVPSSPTFSTWNYSPPSYWSDNNYNRSPPLVIKSEPVGCHQVDETVADSSLEDLLDDYTFDYYSSDIQESLETASSAINHQQHISKPIIIKQEEASSQGHALLRQCLRPAADDYQQRCHLQFLNQIGSAIAALPQQQQQQQQEMLSIKTEKSSPASGNGNSGGYWPNGNPNTAQGLASVLSLVMEQVNEEVRSTCEILGVSPSKFYFFIFRSILLLSAFTLILLVNEFLLLFCFFDQNLCKRPRVFLAFDGGPRSRISRGQKTQSPCVPCGNPLFILSSFSSSSLLFRTKQKGAQREGQSDA
jgi:hypothetical protein